MQRVVLCNVEQGSIASPSETLVVACEMSLGDPGHVPVPTLR